MYSGVASRTWSGPVMSLSPDKASFVRSVQSRFYHDCGDLTTIRLGQVRVKNGAAAYPFDVGSCSPFLRCIQKGRPLQEEGVQRMLDLLDRRNI